VRLDEQDVGNRFGTFCAALAVLCVTRFAATDGADGDHVSSLGDDVAAVASGEVLRVETLRAGSREGGASGLLVRLVERREDDGLFVRHLELVLPGVDSVVHHVEERGARRRLVHRELTGRVGRTVRWVDEGDERASLVTWGEGATLRREVVALADTVFPLERLDDERTGRASSGRFAVVDPLAGRVEMLEACHSVLALPSACAFGAVALDVWHHRDTRGAARSLRVFANGRLVAFQPAPGTPLAVALDPAQFDLLRDRDGDAPIEGSPGR
jgi:hypothetical protein